MLAEYDVLVVGLGATGSQALYQIAKAGQRVLGIDRFTPPHIYGSSHGQSRIIRQAYYESPVYVPLVQEAYGLWHDQERIAGRKLFTQTGGLMLGTPDSILVQGSRLSAETHGLAYEYLDAHAIRTRFPAFQPTPDTVGVFETAAGVLFPEACIETALQLAQAHGAAYRLGETVLSLSPKDNYVEILTVNGTHTARQVIVSAGAWLAQLVPELALPLTVARQVVFWFDHAGGRLQSLQPDHFPIYIWETGDTMFYGFPDQGNGLKVAFHHYGEPADPNNLNRQVTSQEISAIESVIGRHFGIDPIFREASVCMYTNTPDMDFIIDRHPQHNNVIIASPCSGHGFKFASAIGKILVDMIMDRPIDFDLTPFRIDRFTA
ncbi:N-methyl-L-tryptophan oxidase [Fulvivirgaceae bacterium PWU5]|uniref:N-methyl-L-tryptophan oxidase n=1 Tax=Dawidia cretensis TaxID=2782350 RepID=A0AAP2E5F3_9BACT|nr:N-methyl-L-tryptophan oxidase [Dawidia cretensis]MBT1712382.1 N-methyl-L-tryptophan oxidase [Dawidia cretensis]